MNSPLIVLIATAGANTLLESTLKSLSQCHRPPSYLKTLVVENGGRFQAQAIVNQFASSLGAEYRYYPQGNKSAALNHALQYLPDEALIFFADDDVQLDREVLVAYERADRGRVSRCFYGGPTRAIYEKKPPAWLLEALPASTRGWHPGNNNDYQYTPRFLGFNWATYAGDVKSLGGFNENLGPGTKPKRTGQEWNMQERMLADGFTAVYVEDAIVWHHVPQDKSSLGWFVKRRFQGGLGAGMWFVEKHGKEVAPMGLIKYLVKSCLLLPLSLLSLSRAKIVVEVGNVVAGLGRVQGYLLAYFSKNL